MPSQNAPLIGSLWMFVTGLLFIAVTAIVKWVGSDVPAAQAAFVRYAMGLLFVVPMIPALRRATIPRLALSLSVLRGAAHTVAIIAWFFAMSRIPIAEVTAMNYITPLYVTLGAALFLGERISWMRMSAIGMAILGTLFILRPGFREVEPGHLAMLLGTLAFGVSFLTAKPLSSLVSAPVDVALLSIGVTLGLAPIAYVVWVPIAWQDLVALFLVAILATAGHYTMTLAFAVAPVSVTQPITFLQLVWSVAIGVVFIAEPIDLWVIAGGVMIVIAVVFVAIREAQIAARSQGSAAERVG